jgi:phosphoribosylglycinamide formyltransferase 1
MTPITGRPIRLAVLISGGGTTLGNFLTQIADRRLDAEVSVVIASRPDCGGLLVAEAAGIPACVVQRSDHADIGGFSRAIFDHCRAAGVDLVTLAGYLCRIEIPADFAQRVMNIHPALIPAFCGRGMYGRHVHEAVLARGCKVSGCTVHFADNEYDHGPIISQRCVAVHDDDTPESLAARVFAAECEAYPEAIRLFAADRLQCTVRIVHTQPGQAPHPD